MAVFDKNYYDTIWPEQSVHRHEHCENLANSLIQKYGRVKILDIGTGCGFLVKLLREKGCDAWCAWAESCGYEPKITKALLEKNKEWIKGLD